MVVSIESIETAVSGTVWHGVAFTPMVSKKGLEPASMRTHDRQSHGLFCRWISRCMRRSPGSPEPELLL
jgi:hypothetical protein